MSGRRQQFIHLVLCDHVHTHCVQHMSDSVSLVLREALDLGGEANNEGLVKRDLLILYIVRVVKDHGDTIAFFFFQFRSRGPSVRRVHDQTNFFFSLVSNYLQHM